MVFVKVIVVVSNRVEVVAAKVAVTLVIAVDAVVVLVIVVVIVLHIPTVPIENRLIVVE